MEKSEINRIFGAHIKNMRQDRGWSQRDLAAKMGNDYQNISALERGQYTPTLYVLLRLAQCFDVNLSDLLYPMEKILVNRQSPF